MKPIWMSVAVMLAVVPGSAGAQKAAAVKAAGVKVPAAVIAALADPARADQQGDDARRQAAEVIAFAGAKPGDTIVDYLPGSGYWTRIFTGVVGPKGKVIPMWPQAAAKRAEQPLAALQARGLANVVPSVQAGNLPVVDAPVDLFWTVQNYHDVPAAFIVQFNQAVFKALKPGGIYLVIDHADAPGAVPVKEKHRIDPAVAKSQILAAGFRFVGESKVLANPADDHLLGVFDPAIRGKTDQFVYKFRKP